MVALAIFRDVAPTSLRPESGQHRVGPLTDDPESALNLIRDLRRMHRSDVLNLPHLNPLPGRFNPILTEMAVFGFHEH